MHADTYAFDVSRDSPYGCSVRRAVKEQVSKDQSPGSDFVKDIANEMTTRVRCVRFDWNYVI